MKAVEFSITKENMNDLVKLIITGRIDSINAYKMQQDIDEIFRSGQHNVVLNMNLVDYICSIGIRVVLKAYKDANEAKGKVRIENPSENVLKILQITSTTDMLLA
jgi:anti-anti-sigma factor